MSLPDPLKQIMFSGEFQNYVFICFLYTCWIAYWIAYWTATAYWQSNTTWALGFYCPWFKMLLGLGGQGSWAGPAWFLILRRTMTVMGMLI